VVGSYVTTIATTVSRLPSWSTGILPLESRVGTPLAAPISERFTYASLVTLLSPTKSLLIDYTLSFTFDQSVCTPSLFKNSILKLNYRLTIL